MVAELPRSSAIARAIWHECQIDFGVPGARDGFTEAARPRALTRAMKRLGLNNLWLMAAPTDSESGGTPRGEGRGPLRLAEANELHETPGGPYGSDLAQMIAALRARVDEEYRIMERLDAKARQAFALVVAFFAVVQAVAFGAFAQGEITTADRVILAALAIVAGLSIGVVGDRLRNQEALQEERDLDPDKLLGWWREATGENYVSQRVAVGLAEIAKVRFANNETRAARYKKLDSAARFSLILTSVELLWAIVIRV